jgi:hypothetical protein
MTEQITDPLPAWLYQRLSGPGAPAWDQLTDDKRASWERSACEVQRILESHTSEKTGVTIWQEQRDELEQLRAELDTERERYKASLRRADEHVNAMSEELKRYADGKETPVLWSVYNAMHLRAATAEARVAELETERAKYVGVEPTIAEEMAYLSRCLDAVHEACDRAVRQATRPEHPLPIPDWVDTVRQAADGATEPLGTRPALPWAHLMDDGDLHEFLGDLVSATIDRWRSEPDIPDRDILANIEKVCADWRTPGRGYRSDEPGAGEGR